MTTELTTLPLYPLDEKVYRKSRPVDICPNPVPKSGIEHHYFTNSQHTRAGTQIQFCMGCKMFRIIKDGKVIREGDKSCQL